MSGRDDDTAAIALSGAFGVAAAVLAGTLTAPVGVAVLVGLLVTIVMLTGFYVSHGAIGSRRAVEPARTVVTSGPEDRPGDPEWPAVVFVHGLFSSARVWSDFDRLIRQDRELDRCSLNYFEYETPIARPHLLRRIPDLDAIADLLAGHLDRQLSSQQPVVLVAHSQGGLVVHRYLASQVGSARRGRELARIRSVAMFACPNGGSNFGLMVRRLAFWGHTQVRGLRPLDRDTMAAIRTVLDQVVHAPSKPTDTSCRIPMFFYAGASDAVVTRQSAQGPFPVRNTGTVPGDHSGCVRPSSPRHLSYVMLRDHLLRVVAETEAETEAES